jgi:two-component system sensor histidine kinase UhpB
VRVATVGVPDIDVIAERFNHMSSVLQRSSQETQLIAQRSLVIQEDERRRLAQELHDELGQSISAIKALAVSIRARTAAFDAALTTSANTIVEVSTDIYDQVRRMMAQLRPVVLDELGLVSALQSMVDDWNARHEDTFCRFSLRGAAPPLSDHIAINCYRIVQEALTNIAKHARADEASVAIEFNQDGREKSCALGITIEDNGVGFDSASVMRGLGLVGIGERVDAMHGEMQFETAPQCGTRYRICVPNVGEDAPNGQSEL